MLSKRFLASLTLLEWFFMGAILKREFWKSVGTFLIVKSQLGGWGKRAGLQECLQYAGYFCNKNMSNCPVSCILPKVPSKSTHLSEQLFLFLIF